MGRARARKQRHTATPRSIAVQRQRTAEALARGAFQKARELAQELCQHDPTAEHRQWLVSATLGRAAELRAARQVTQAVALLRGIGEVACDSAALLARCAGELLLLGEWPAAEHLVAQVNDASLLSHLQALHVDAAILHGAAGLASLAEARRQEAQSILRALAFLDQHEDIQAQEAVASIPTSSPAHDWKLLIQGLAAFYASDPTALERWQQLTPERVPAAMAAPFRAQLDPAFVANQAPPVRAELAAFGRRLHAATWLRPLEDTRHLLAQEALPAAVRRAAEAARAMPPECHELRQRLTRTLYWAVAQYGNERDILAYRKAFGTPPDDPELHRLQALCYEHAEDLIAAQELWARYEADVQRRGLGGDADTALARALVWLRMGELAEKVSPPVPSDVHLPLPPGFDEEDTCPFSAIECYRHSIALAPQCLEAHERLLTVTHQARQQEETVETAQRLLEHFPEHQRALQVLADNAFRQERWDEAVAYQERAVQGRPHDTTLTARLAFYSLGLARLRAQQGQFEAARAILAAELARDTTPERYHLLCRQAAVEIKAGQPQRGDELFAQACQMAASRLPVVFHMLIEAIRMPLEPQRITQLERDFRRALKEKAEVSSALAMLSLLKAFATLGISYAGLPAHQKLVLQYLKRLLRVPLREAELQILCSDLEIVSDNKLLLDFATRGCKEFPLNPRFPYAAAQYYLALGPERCPVPRLHATLERALLLSQANPAYADLAHDIEALQRVLDTLTFLGELNQRMQDFDMDDEPPPELLAALTELLGPPGAIDWFDDDDNDEWDEPPRSAPRRGARRKQRKR
jgi:tetratricopeptide (TPR) repeat protein